MKKFIMLLSALLLFQQFSNAQTYNNEWINYNNTYYKFKVSENKLYRISRAVLQNYGLGSTQADQFQLWRNGVQVPIFTSVSTGIFGIYDYIEFWGVPNDGIPDASLYKLTTYLQNKKWSLYNDTATYYLTVNPTVSQNLRLTNSVNNVASNTLQKDQNFSYTVGYYPKDKINNGYNIDIGEMIYSSSYDKGEGWSSNNIYPGSTHSTTFNNLYPDLATAILPSYTFKGFINETSSFNLSHIVNGTTLLTNFYATEDTINKIVTFPVNQLSSGSVTLDVSGSSSTSSDNFVVASKELTYKRLFNFGNATSFEFNLPSNALGNYIEIDNFNNGGYYPVLYDLTNNKRYVADINGNTLRFALPNNGNIRKLVLVSQATGTYNYISSLESKSFVNLMASSNQGNFLILTSKILHSTTNASNAIEMYKDFRNSSAGGSFNTKIIDVEDLYDQYSFGIKNHVIALRNYLQQARNVFSVAPSFVLIIGRGVVYTDAKANEADPELSKLNLVPTFGYPASDILIASDPGTYVQNIPIGRIGAINETEVLNYLNKVKEYEFKLNDMNFTIDNKAWMKNSTYISGNSEPYLQSTLDNYHQLYMTNWKLPKIGGNPYLFTKTQAGGVVPLNYNFMKSLWTNGHSFVEYFGHSSKTIVSYLNEPTDYSNPGKYPMIMVNGCNAGDYYNFEPLRTTKEFAKGLSEKFVLTPNRGGIGFIASTYFGIVNLLHSYCLGVQTEMENTSYGLGIGEIMKNASINIYNSTPDDYYTKVNLEQENLEGDPSVKLYTSYPKSDYVIENQSIKFNSNFYTIADDSIKFNFSYMNLAKYIANDSIHILVERILPNGTTIMLNDFGVLGTNYKDSFNIASKINPLQDVGINKIRITVDSKNQVNEMSETNNSVTIDFTINDVDAKPVFPYNYAIVNQLPLVLKASSVNPLSISKTYNLEVDTTELFNSPSKITSNKTQIGGLVEFPAINSLTANTVYYWRVSVAGVSPLHWNTFSFTYLPTSTLGFNQGHYFQELKSTYNNIHLDSASRRLLFDSTSYDILVRNGNYPNAGYQGGHFTITVNQDAYIRGLCELNSITFNLMNPKTGIFIKNTGGLYGSSTNNCVVGSSDWNFTFLYQTLAQRNIVNNFMQNNIPDGYYVFVRNFNYNSDPINNVNNWIGDATANGNGQSMYNSLKSKGFTLIDSVNDDRAFIFLYNQNSTNYVAKQVVSEGKFDRIYLTDEINIPQNNGIVSSPTFGPAKQWKEVHWKGTTFENSRTNNTQTNNDLVSLNVIGVTNTGLEQQLFLLDSTQQDFDISSINATQYPYIKLKMSNSDAVEFTPWQLNYWRLNYIPVPEGAVAPNIDFFVKDTFNLGETINTKLAFKNISSVNFDSLSVTIYLLDSSSNLLNTYILPKSKALVVNDTILINYIIPNNGLAGNYVLLFEVNPNNSQLEQFHFNNLLYKKIFVGQAGLPVNWFKVSAVLQNNKSVINWSTATEQNTKKFEVEYSTDGRNFNYIGETPAAGFSNSIKNYTLIHEKPVFGINYYRIKQIDLNNNFKYSIIVTVVMRDKFNETLVGPIPTTDFINIFEPKPIKIKNAEIYDQSGKLISNLSINNVISSFTLPTKMLPAGNYVLKINYENEQKAYKFIKN